VWFEEGAGVTRWLGVVEGFYGPPLAHEDRLDLLAWVSRWGFTCYGYAPKDEPLHRQRWREAYGDDDRARFADLLQRGKDLGVDVALVLSPGLDWRDGDEEALIAKLRGFRDLGADVLGIAWDDVPPGGADLGAVHGQAVAAAVAALDDGVRWITCPTDYATAQATPYLEAYAGAVPTGVEIMWTGPSIVSPSVSVAGARAMAEVLGRPPLFAENFPVNDGAMSDVLHLGPYPARPADLPAATSGAFCNLMPRSRASYLGLALAARFWTDPSSDREAAWREVVAEIPGLEPLARASRTWACDPEIDAELTAWADAAIASDGADTRLRDYLVAGCRNGLDPRLAAELEPWLDQWDAESQAMQLALQLLSARPARPADLAFVTSELWRRARQLPAQVFGVRWAYYPVTQWAEGRFHALPEALVAGENLTDRLCRAALTG
jgi:hyaluronoglucosaminidase